MRCAWEAFIRLLPIWMREQVDKQGRDTLQELRLRIRAKPELVKSSGQAYLEQCITGEDLRFCVNAATRYSPWAATTVSKGYITAEGGHRIGLCGTAVISDGNMKGICEPSSLCIRVARDFIGIAEKTSIYTGSVLVIGRPGSGKTTLMRDMIRIRSDKLNECICVVDERQEIFPYANNQACFPAGIHTDILSGCGKSQGIEIMLRNMGPDTIAVDEITAKEDCAALLHAGWCGVNLLATAHAGNIRDLKSRPIYRPLLDSQIFDTVIVMRPDKSWYAERMTK